MEQKLKVADYIMFDFHRSDRGSSTSEFQSIKMDLIMFALHYNSMLSILLTAFN